MRSLILSTSISASIFLTGAIAQDAPSAAEPTIKLGGDDAAAADRERVKLTEDDTPTITAPAAAGKAAPGEITLDLGETKMPESLTKMSEEDRRKLGGLLQDAATYLGGIRVQEAFEKLVVAEAMAPDYAPVHNLKGAAYTKLRDFDKAGASFKMAVTLDPRAFMSKFNLTEIYFVSGQFAEAEKSFKELLAENAKMPAPTKALIDFKILIARLKQGDEAGARGILDTFDYLDDHPGYYFGNAAVHFNKDEQDEAKEWMRSAEKIYGKNQINIYTDSFIEVGWIENFQ